MPPTDPRTHEAIPGDVLVAVLTLRFGEHHRLSGRVYWPATGADAGSPLIFVAAVVGAEDSDPLCRALCSAVATVVLAVPSLGARDHDDEVAALGWAAEHGAQLGAPSEQLMVAGEGPGGARAAQLAARSRDNGWPQLRRQVLVYPTFTQTCPMPSLLTSVAPATVISSDTRIDDGSTYASRLRAAGIEVQELRRRPPILPGHDDLWVELSGRRR
jgi:hypothetical protein